MEGGGRHKLRISEMDKMNFKICKSCKFEFCLLPGNRDQKQIILR